MSSPQRPQPTIIYPRFPAPLDQATVESLFNKLYRALQKLGRVVRTIYLLGWINDDDLRGQVTRTTNKVESFHALSAYLDFGSAGIIATNNSVEQEKAGYL